MRLTCNNCFGKGWVIDLAGLLNPSNWLRYSVPKTRCSECGGRGWYYEVRQRYTARRKRY